MSEKGICIREVRVKASAGLGRLIAISMRIDPLLTELSAICKCLVVLYFYVCMYVCINVPFLNIYIMYVCRCSS